MSERAVTQMVLEEVEQERRSQDRKWGQQNHDPERWFTILGEEVGEVAEAVLEADAGRGKYREELIQTAAVAVAAVEAFDRQAT